MSYDTINRRTALKLTGSVVTAATTAGAAGAGSGRLVEVNVGYDGPDGRKAALDAATEVVREFNFDALTVRVPDGTVEALADHPGVRYLEPNGDWQTLVQTTPYGAQCIDAPEAWECGYRGDGAHVAIIDTGIDSDHPDLDDNLGVGKAFVSCTGSNCSYAWDDDHDHGTHVAGIAAAEDNNQGTVGVAPEATLHAVKVIDRYGSGSWSDIAAGIEYTADQGWDVANLSLGGSSGSVTVKDACQYAYHNGVLLVAAAGNDGPCTDCVSYPAAYEECIAVGAVDCTLGLTGYSSTGPEVELVAPGDDIYSTTIGGYDTYSGTSMAAPHVSGVGALLMAAGYSNQAARDRMCETACDLGLPDDEQGCGRVDADAAVGCGMSC